MSSEPIDYLVHFYFVADGVQYRGVSERSLRNSSLYDSFLERYDPDCEPPYDWTVVDDSRLEHATKWSAEDRAHLLTLETFNKQFLKHDAKESDK